MLVGAALLAGYLAAAPMAASGTPLQASQANPHYLSFHGEPIVVIGSSEHYGAVINLAFDYHQYLAAIQAAGLNGTRVFTGTYRELPGRFAPDFDFAIVENTLAPKGADFLAPWPRTGVPGASDGLNKFNLTRWDERYFDRLTDFISEADRHGIIVEITLFSTFYGDNLWHASPLNAMNNVNGVGAVPRGDALSLKEPKLVEVEDRLVRKIVGALQKFDNVYYEICNEPDVGHVSRAWQEHIARDIEETEAPSGGHHLIAEELSVDDDLKRKPPITSAELYLFHYAHTPKAVLLTYPLRKPVGDNENGADGQSDAPYRVEAWQFMLSGGALSIGLDYSFTTSSPNGRFIVPATQPGGGGESLRAQLGILRGFLQSMEFVHMTPLKDVIVSRLPTGTSAAAFGNTGKVYAIYIQGGQSVHQTTYRDPAYRVDGSQKQVDISVRIARGTYLAEWINTKTGAVEKTTEVVAEDSRPSVLASPRFSEDIALRISKR